ncbi:orotidine-5'-phosphate decarboxylase [Cytobacillus kochii]|uniref:orotidine-5'-phosphate decarboxylase n=1 Tax=Cytobacillus kochii TaxID=859143 RepID=UPI00203E6238|nr:orotidine-5'-phosphate decarboxylase [Cytobacillus kochii]MCM3321772.1 orotidine-5'-phosphate decarboxylase [Cytobacillus kochii]MCM3343394.1 orotidine-5'-phosphate decarboxylase [Cytobacillus kochii]
MKNSLIIALDFANRQQVEDFLKPFTNEQLFLKVGMELYYQEGPQIVERLKSEGHQVFLDLKLHDIPNTVKSAMKGLARLGCDLVNVHAAGGIEMMRAAVEGLEEGKVQGKERAKLIAVTQLTSTSRQQMNSEQLIPVSLNESVLHYSQITKQAGLDGVVCSPFEAKQIAEKVGADFLTVTPGIRMETDDKQDQKRVATPDFASSEGVSAIVVGRSITRASNSLAAYYQIKNLWEGISV